MAKLRRSASRPSPVKKTRAAAPAARSKARPAVKKSAPKPAKAAPKKPAPRKAAVKPTAAAKPAPRPAAKAAAARAAAKTEPKGRPKAPAPPPRRSTYADAVLLYERGLQALQAKRYKDAADTLKRVIAEFPEEIELHERAQLYIRVCERQLTPPDATPKTPEEQVYAATLALNAGNTDRAVALATAALQRDAENDAAEYLLGVALASRGDDKGALPHLARALELNPDIRDAVFKEPELQALRDTEELQALLAAAATAPRKEKRAQPKARR
jgi:tetratricopeptide (TPR) repeat protein